MISIRGSILVAAICQVNLLAYLYGQLERVDEINVARNKIWDTYFESFFKDLAPEYIELPFIPSPAPEMLICFI